MDDSSTTGRDGLTAENVALNERISKAASEVNFAKRLADRGQVTVVMDSEGRMIRRRPDGTTSDVEMP